MNRKMNILYNLPDKPYKIFADVEMVEEGALQQFVNTMNQPQVTRGALMPDAHTGYTVPIGCVFETDHFIYPSAVGYDIGCGMCAIPTTFSVKEIRNHSQEIQDEIFNRIPVGFSKFAFGVHEKEMINPMSDTVAEIFYNKKGVLQLGTLGGGNHFIEIGYDNINDLVWIIIHSGSRGVGHEIASHYMKLASPTGKASEGHYGFDTDSTNGINYVRDMNWGLSFALLNREVMIRLVIDSIRACGVDGEKIGEMINRNHNHAESRDGGNHWIHRKGATHAEKGMLGVIPGNMRDGSFIVVGKGNAESLYSSSHGAGRVMGRKKAKETLNVEDFALTMEGITAIVNKSTLDESPDAYKNIFEVMELQKDLVDIKHYIRPIINVKDNTKDGEEK